MLDNKRGSLLTWRSVAVALVGLILLVGCEFEQDPSPYSKGASLQSGVYYVSSRRWNDRGLEWLVDEGQSIRLVSNPPTAIKSDTTIFIHGFNAPERWVANYFRGLISYLQQAPGYRASPIVYDWPSRTTHFNELSAWERMTYGLDGPHNPTLAWESSQYSADGVWARQEGAPGLIALIEKLEADNSDSNIDIIAHSMGCLVVAEAMKRKHEAFAGVRRVFWLAPDLTSDVLEDKTVQKGISHIENLHVFFSRNDEILKRLSATMNISRMLGSSGPANPDRVPSNIVLHDLTKSLGKKQVHSSYTMARSAAAAPIANALIGTK